MIFRPMAKSLLESLIREILSESYSIPRPPGYEEALRDTERTNQSITDEFGISMKTVFRDRKARGITTGREKGPDSAGRQEMPGYEDALHDKNRSLRDIAAEFEISPAAVFNDRKARGIQQKGTSAPTYGRNPEKAMRGGALVKEMPPEYYRMLGNAPIKTIADLFGVSGVKVMADIKREGVPNFGKGRPPKKMPDEYYDLLGKMSDLNLGTRFGVSVAKVIRDRLEAGIESYGESGPVDVPDEYYEALGNATDQEVADRFGVSSQKVMTDRQILDIPAYFKGR